MAVKTKKSTADEAKVALLKAAGLTDEQIAALGASAPAIPAPTMAPAPVAAVVSGVGNPGAVPALEKKGAKASLFGKMAKLAPATEKSKSKTPEVMIPEAQQFIDELLTEIATKKRAEARIGELGEDVAKLTEPKRVEISRQCGELEESLYVNKRMTFVQPHGYKGVSTDKESALREVFGAEYDAFFEPKMEVKVADEDALGAIYDDLEVLCKAKGIDLGKLFSVKQTIAPTRALTTARVMRADVAALFDQARAKGLVEPKKFTLKEK